MEPKEKPSLDIQASSPKEPYKITEDISIPASINQYLRSYQRDGAAFLYHHFANKTGCILADDMGLGKTIQVISFFSAVMKKTGTESDALRKNRCSNYRFLVVAPTSVLYNWIDELETWGYFRVGKFHRQNKEEVIDEVRAGKLEILMTTHETMRINIDMLNVIDWSAVILDEAHKIKQPSSQITIAANQLNSTCKFGLTGTPLQNNLKELWCLLDWANPRCLSSSDEFDLKYARPICIGQRYNANKRELATARKKKQELNMLHKRWMLRRTKDMIQDQLPVKDEKIVFCSLSSLQVSMYETILKLPKVKRLNELDQVCQCGSEKISRKCCLKNFNWRKWLFPYIQILLKTSNHAALLLPHHNQRAEQKEMCKEICELLFSKYPKLQEMYKKKKFSQMSDPSYCGKMTVLQKLLGVLYAKRDKVLLFSHSTQLLNILEAYVMGRGMIYRRLDGDTAAEKRNVIVKEFNSDSSIFICLLSTTAGSLGLNLTAANFVIIFDPLWNPIYDQQAQDRAYRIGQQRNVYVYRFISVGTIEENIYMRQIYKQQLANIAINTSNERRYFAGVAGDKNHRGELFGIANMFKFSNDHNSVLAKQTFDKVKSVENGVQVAEYEVRPIKSREIDSVEESVEEPVKDQFEATATQCINEECSDDDDDGINHKSELQKGATYDNLLTNCGVTFATSTKSVVGSSEAEQKLSMKAMKDVFWDGMNSQLPANDNDEDTSSEDEEENIGNSSKVTSSKKGNSIPNQIFERVGSDMFIIGCTPPAIQTKHFDDIAKQSGFDDVVNFAKHLKLCTSKNINKLLKMFYSEKEPNITQLSIFNQIYDCKDTDNLNVLTGKLRRRKANKVRSKLKTLKHTRRIKKSNWNEIHQERLSDNDIKEYESDDEDVKDRRNEMSTPDLRKFKQKQCSNSFELPVSSPIPSLKYNAKDSGISSQKQKQCSNTFELPVSSPIPSQKYNAKDSGISSQKESLSSVSNQYVQTIEKKSIYKIKSEPSSILDELIFSPKSDNETKYSPFKSQSISSDTDVTLENIISSSDIKKKTLRHSLDKLIGESSCLKKPSTPFPSPASYSETNSHEISRCTMGTKELAEFIHDNENSSVLDDLIGSSTNHTQSPRKKSKHDNYNNKPSILDDFF